MWNRKRVEVTVSADDLVVSTTDMKQYLRVTDSGDDDLITAHVQAATAFAKEYLRRGLQTETHVLWMDGFSEHDPDAILRDLGPGWHDVAWPFVTGWHDRIDLPYPPVASVTSVETWNRANAVTTVSADVYSVGDERIWLNAGYAWPSNLRDTAAVKITYVSGYGAANVPKPIVEAIKIMAAQLYEGCAAPLNDAARDMLAPWRRVDDLQMF